MTTLYPVPLGGDGVCLPPWASPKAITKPGSPVGSHPCTPAAALPGMTATKILCHLSALLRQTVASKGQRSCADLKGELDIAI